MLSALSLTYTHSFQKRDRCVPHFPATICSRAGLAQAGSAWNPSRRNLEEGAISSQPHLILPREAPVPSPTSSPAPRHLHGAPQPVPQCELVSEPASPAPRAASQPPPSVLPDAPAPGTPTQILPSPSSPDPEAVPILSPPPRVLPSPAPPEPAPSLHLHPSPPPGRGRALASPGWEGP